MNYLEKCPKAWTKMKLPDQMHIYT